MQSPGTRFGFHSNCTVLGNPLCEALLALAWEGCRGQECAAVAYRSTGFFQLHMGVLEHAAACRSML